MKVSSNILVSKCMCPACMVRIIVKCLAQLSSQKLNKMNKNLTAFLMSVYLVGKMQNGTAVNVDLPIVKLAVTNGTSIQGENNTDSM